MRLYIIRHGDPNYALDALTPDGHLEAEALAERMEAEGLDRIYASSMGRAKETAAHTAERLGLPVGEEHWIREHSLRLTTPEWGSIPGMSVPGEHIRGGSDMPTHANWHQMAPFDASEYRETFDEVRSGSDEFLARHGYVRDGGVYRIEKGNREKIAMFCHGGSGRTWLAHLLEVPLTLAWSGFTIFTSSVTIILFDERSDHLAVPRCIAMGDTSHLYKAGLPIKFNGLQANHY